VKRTALHDACRRALVARPVGCCAVAICVALASVGVARGESPQLLPLSAIADAQPIAEHFAHSDARLRAMADGEWRPIGDVQYDRLVRPVAWLEEPDVVASPSDEPRRFGPPVLEAPLPDFIPLPELAEQPVLMLRWPVDPPLGYSGPSGILPREEPDSESSHFIPMEDRWRVGFPEWDRYGQEHPFLFEYPYAEGSLWDPYHQNVLKGDYPILGQHTFFVLTAVENLLLETRQVPTPTTPFESTADPDQEEFFGDPDQFFLNNNLVLSLVVNHGDGAFKPVDWRIKLTQIYNMNHLVVDELGIVNPDVRRGTARFRQDYATEEYFVEAKLADLSPDYDFLSVRAGSQPFVSDFRGFLFADINRGVRLFGTGNANRDQFNLMWLDQTEKETNSLLNTWDDRHQNTVIANYYRQDFIWPGYTSQVSYHYNRDQADFLFGKNDTLVRPDPVGVFAPHEVNAHYIGWAGDGHINRFNISHAFYWAVGHDELNPIAGPAGEHQCPDARRRALL
jgi:hypothetical protein